jgi:hypothetical protein
MVGIACGLRLPGFLKNWALIIMGHSKFSLRASLSEDKTAFKLYH